MLTVTARDVELTALAKSLGRQKVTRPTQWIVVDALFPVKRNHLMELHQRYLARWQVVYAPAPLTWAGQHGYRQLAAARNESLLLSGLTRTPKGVLCCALDDDLTIEGPNYLTLLWESARRRMLLIPPIHYETGTKRHVSGNAATPFWLHDALEMNGYDELFDANWPGTSTYEDVDLLFRLKTLGLTIANGGKGLALRHHASAPTHFKNGVKCNHILRGAGSPIEQGGGGFNWDTNGEVPPWAMQVFSQCPWLARDRCELLGRRCEIDLDVARWGHRDLANFLKSRRVRNLMDEWMRGEAARRDHIIGFPLSIELE